MRMGYNEVNVDSDQNPTSSYGGIRRFSDVSPLKGSRQSPQDDLTRTSTIESRKGRTRQRDPLVEDGLNQDAGYDADVEVIKPYAIEEPEDDVDTSPQSTWPATPRLLDSVPSWQNEIVSSMRNLYCDSDSTDADPRLRPKRGRKRKSTSRPPNYGEENPYEHVPGLRKDEMDMQSREEPVASPRKLRRRSTKSRKDSVLMRDGSISSPFRGEVSGTDLTSGQVESNNASSRMDLD